MVSIINRNYVYEKVNKPFSSAHKGVIKSFIGKSLSDVWGTSTFQNKIKKRVDLCFTGRTVRYEASFNTPRSGHRYYEIVFRPMKSRSGVVTHLMAETFDVTDLKQSKTTAIELRKEFRKKEIDFSNRMLLAHRLESIGVLAGGIAHDFNNILATISGYTEMLQEDFSKDHSLTEKTEKILTAVKKGQSIINQILTFSRQVEDHKKTVDVNGILKETADFAKTLSPHTIVINTELQGIPIPVFADPTQLFRVFLNLITNAIQAMEEKGGELTISTFVLNSDQVKSGVKMRITADEYVLISFRDTGIGMDSGLLPRIFEPFYTTREVGKGTGLGLSVVYGIVTEMEGEILVSSKVNEGSVFEVYLPVTNH